jgi:dTDP-glucose pyrophosphorylase
MIILIPMGGKGSRFSDAGYKINKACIPTTDRHTGEKLPMVICAMKDIPGINDPKNKIICVDRDFHETNGTEKVIQKFFPNTTFIHDHVMLDQAFGCFLARELLQSKDELFIGACDNGFVYNEKEFDKAKSEFDVLMISHRNDDNIAQNPNAHSWAKLKPGLKELESISLKKTVSGDPMVDHATTGMFWFKHASDFLVNLEKMIWKKDTLDGKYYVDKVLQYCIESELKVGYFDVKYICWGTPIDYENYEKTISYWKEFAKQEGIL